MAEVSRTHMTGSEERELKEAIVASVPYANTDEPLRFGDVARATCLLDEGSEVVGTVREVQFWFNSMDDGHLTVVCIDDGDETLYCDPDGMELADAGGGADGRDD